MKHGNKTRATVPCTKRDKGLPGQIKKKSCVIMSSKGKKSRVTNLQYHVTELTELMFYKNQHNFCPRHSFAEIQKVGFSTKIFMTSLR